MKERFIEYTIGDLLEEPETFELIKLKLDVPVEKIVLAIHLALADFWEE